MVHQLWLPGMAPPADKLFFALLPDNGAARRAGKVAFDLRTELRLRGRATPPERLHVSLFRVGVIRDPADPLVSLASVAAGIAANAPAFDIGFDRIMSFKGHGNRPLVLAGSDTVALRTFRYALGEAMQAVGLPCDPKAALLPHVTLLYDRRPVPERTVEPITWTVRDFVLIHSLFGQARHVRLGRWPLKGAA